MVARVVKTNTHLNTIVLWWNDIKLYLAVGLLCGVCGALGFTIGSIQVKNQFDQAAINSGHAQYHPTKGTIEWKICK